MRLWMRWGTLAFGAVLGLVPVTSHAEDQRLVRRTVVMAQPLYGLSGQLAASVDHAVGEHVALAGTARITVQLEQQAGAFLPEGNSLWRFGVGLEPGVHYYFAGQAPEGFWVGPHLEASVLQLNYGRDIVLDLPGGSAVPLQSSGREFEFGGSAQVGYTAILSPGFCVQVGLGLGALYRETSTASSVEGWRVGPRVSLGLGWAF